MSEWCTCLCCEIPHQHIDGKQLRLQDDFVSSIKEIIKEMKPSEPWDEKKFFKDIDHRGKFVRSEKDTVYGDRIKTDCQLKDISSVLEYMKISEE